MIMPLGEGANDASGKKGFLNSLKFWSRLKKEQRILLSVTFWVVVLLGIAVTVFSTIHHTSLAPEEEDSGKITEARPTPVSTLNTGFDRQTGIVDTVALTVRDCNRMGRSAQDAGRHKAAIRFFELAQEKAAAGDAGEEVAWTEYASSLATLGHLCFDQTPEDCDCAIGYYQKALVIARQIELTEDPRYVMVAKRLKLCESGEVGQENE